MSSFFKASATVEPSDFLLLEFLSKVCDKCSNASDKFEKANKSFLSIVYI